MHELDDITGLIVDSAVRIHRELGPGLLESVYELVLERELVVREPGVTKCLTFDLRQRTETTLARSGANVFEINGWSAKISRGGLQHQIV